MIKGIRTVKSLRFESFHYFYFIWFSTEKTSIPGYDAHFSTHRGHFPKSRMHVAIDSYFSPIISFFIIIFAFTFFSFSCLERGNEARRVTKRGIGASGFHSGVWCANEFIIWKEIITRKHQSCNSFGRRPIFPIPCVWNWEILRRVEVRSSLSPTWACNLED